MAILVGGGIDSGPGPGPGPPGPGPGPPNDEVCFVEILGPLMAVRCPTGEFHCSSSLVFTMPFAHSPDIGGCNFPPCTSPPCFDPICP